MINGFIRTSSYLYEIEKKTKEQSKMSELEELHFACFKGRIAYWQKTGIDLPIERFYAVKEDNGDIVVRIRRQNK